MVVKSLKVFRVSNNSLIFICFLSFTHTMDILDNETLLICGIKEDTTKKETKIVLKQLGFSDNFTMNSFIKETKYIGKHRMMQITMPILRSSITFETLLQEFNNQYLVPPSKLPSESVRILLKKYCVKCGCEIIPYELCSIVTQYYPQFKWKLANKKNEDAICEVMTQKEDSQFTVTHTYNISLYENNIISKMIYDSVDGGDLESFNWRNAYCDSTIPPTFKYCAFMFAICGGLGLFSVSNSACRIGFCTNKYLSKDSEFYKDTPLGLDKYGYSFGIHIGNSSKIFIIYKGSKYECKREPIITCYTSATYFMMQIDKQWKRCILTFGDQWSVRFSLPQQFVNYMINSDLTLICSLGVSKVSAGRVRIALVRWNGYKSKKFIMDNIIE